MPNAADHYGTRLPGFRGAATALVALAVAIGAAAYFSARSDRWVAHTHAVIDRLGEIAMLQERVAATARGAVMFGRRSDHEAFRATNHALRTATHDLVDLVADNPAQQARARELRALVADRLADPERALTELAVIDPARREALLLDADAKHGEVSLALARMRGVEEQLLAQRDDRERLATWALAIAAAGGVAFSLFAIAYGTRRLRHENRQRAGVQAELDARNRDLERSLADTERVSEDLSRLATFGMLLQGVSTLEDIVGLVEPQLAPLTPGHGGTLYVIKASRDHADAVATWGTHTVVSDAAPSPSACWAIRRNAPHVAGGVNGSVFCEHAHPVSPSDSSTCLPLTGHGTVFGWLYFSPAAGAAPLNLRVLTTACEQLASAIANVRLRDALRTEAIRDPLTGLFNRRYLEEGLRREIARCRRRDVALTLMILDLDHFKPFNDRHGHAGGDAVLTAFGLMLQEMARGEDIACRLGGEEFVLVLPEAPLEVAIRRADEIRQRTATLRIAHDGRVLDGLTVSIGVSTMGRDGTDARSLLRAADEALYRAKRLGRDRVES